MRITPNSVDFYLTADGDILFDETQRDDNIRRATADMDEIILVSVMKRLQSRNDQWATAPELGANLSEFSGMPNNQETASLIEARIASALTADGLIGANDIYVEVFPLSAHEIFALLLIQSMSEPVPVAISFSYNLRDNVMIPRDIS